MGIVNKQARLKALKRQELLHTIHCKECVNRNEKNSPEFCEGCVIYGEFKKLGLVFDSTIKEREKQFIKN